MKPRKLRIKGLNSFIEEQEIDFERLTEKGLFGIFGPTGSGKSTILDAITLSLYGAISRDTREFMNSLCSSLSVSYEFEIGVGSERKIYIADRVINKDKAGIYKLKVSRLRELSEDSDVAIAEGANEVKAAVERIIGLTSDDFTRSVVLPQGKFNEFLKLTGKDRRNMLERIFRLEKFGKGLGDKIRNAKKEKNDSLNILEGRVRSYEEKGVSEEHFKELQSELKALLVQEEALKAEKSRLDEQYEKYKAIWELQEEMEYYKRKSEELKLRTEEMELCKERLKRAKNALLVKPLIDELEEINIRIKANETELKNYADMIAELKEKVAGTEKSYKEWRLRKDEELPELIQKESNVSRALELEKLILAIEKERDQLLQQYNVHKTKKQQFEKELQEVNNLRETALNEKGTIESKMESIKVDPEFREKVQRASIIEEDYLRCLKEKEELQQKHNDRLESISKLQKVLSDIQNSQNLCFNEIALTEEKVEELQRMVPGDSSMLLDKKDRINKLDSLIKETETELGRFNEVKLSVDKLKGEKLELDKTINEITLSGEAKRERVKALESEIKLIERNNLASILAKELGSGEPCPVCGSVHHPSLAEDFDDSMTADKKQEKEKLEALLLEEDKKLRTLQIKAASIDSNMGFLSKDFNALSEKLASVSIEELRKEKTGCETEFKELTVKIEEWNKDKEAAEKSLAKKKEQKNNIDKDEVKFSENIKAENKAVEELENSIKLLKEKENSLEGKYKELKSELAIDDIRAKLVELKELEKESISLQKRQKALVDTVNGFDSKKEALNKAINESEIQITRITESGREKRAIIDRDRAEAERLTEGRKADEYIKELRSSKALIIENEELFRKKLEKEKEEGQKLNDKFLSADTNRINLKNSKALLETKLEAALGTYGFENQEQVLQSIMKKEELESGEKEISDYEDNIKNVEANIKRLTKRLGSDSVGKEEWQELQNRRSYAGETLELKIRDIAMKTQSLKDMEKDIQELSLLNAKKRELEHICSNLDDLAKLVEGNKFVEYVAMSQLKYISVEASKRLKDITRGRYALEIDSSGNFIMRDDFNGGFRRATSTLSGGETFLTSLCLALSLSSQIQLKGSAPLEFFFLDEGFGTLDNDLLETVMSSLERLHSDRLCVGIISHVEELKNRVPIKLVVEPAEHGRYGSRVKIELS